jgi:hypothetical protein
LLLFLAGATEAPHTSATVAFTVDVDDDAHAIIAVKHEPQLPKVFVFTSLVY